MSRITPSALSIQRTPRRRTPACPAGSARNVSITTDEGLEWELAPGDLYFVQKIQGWEEATAQRQFDALAAIQNALPLARDGYTVRVWTSRGLVDLNFYGNGTRSEVHLETRETQGSLALCGLRHVETELNRCTRLLALEAVALGLAGDDEEDPPVPVIHTVQLEQMWHRHGIITLFSSA